jgi:hypothetical protein
MRKVLIAVTVVLAGCNTAAKQEPTRVDPVNRAVASVPTEPVNQELVVDKLIQPLSRNEVIVAVRECESNHLRAVMLYGKRKINGYTTDIVVDVTCAPRFNPSF